MLVLWSSFLCDYMLPCTNAFAGGFEYKIGISCLIDGRVPGWQLGHAARLYYFP